MTELPIEVQRSLRNVADPALRAAIEAAAILGHDERRLAAAERHAKWKRAREAGERHRSLTTLAAAALAGEFGRECQSAATSLLRAGHTPAALERVALVVREAKSQP